tara:strand:+ start:59 stop:595 length:537 start_codon:yes stop_codon:yes gene_type:complete
MVLFSHGWRLILLFVITLSSGMLTVDIDNTVQARYLVITPSLLTVDIDNTVQAIRLKGVLALTLILTLTTDPTPDPNPDPNPNNNNTVQAMRLKGVGVEGDVPNPLNSSSSAPSSIALWVVIAMDTCFILLLAAETIAKAATQGIAYLADPWVRLDLAVLIFSIARALFPAWVRTLSS